MINTQTQIDSLIDLAVIQRTELKQLVDSLPQLRDHLSSEIERNLEEIEPAIRSELEQFVAARALDSQAKTSAELSAKLDAMARNLESTTAAKYSVLMAERAENANLLAKAEARIEDAASMLSHAVKEIVTDELSRFPRAGEIDQLRKEFAEPRGLNPRGRWESGATYYKLDLVTYNGDSYVANEETSEKPNRNSSKWTLNAARGQPGGGGFMSPAIGDYTASMITNVPAGTIAATNVQDAINELDAKDVLSLSDGTEAAPSLNFTSDTNTGLYRPAADTVGIVGGGHEILRLTDVANATDYLEIKGAIGVATPVHVIASGPSTNIGMHLQPKGSGLLTISDGTDVNKGIRFRSSSSAASAITLLDAVSTAGRVITLPDATDTLVGKATTDTLTNKTLTTPTIDTITAPASTALTLTGGTSGASLVLGATTTGSLTLTSGNTASSFFINNTSARGPVIELRKSGSAIGFIGAEAAYLGSGTSSILTLGSITSLNFYTNYSGTETARFTTTGNLLIGTTTDAASLAGGLVINGSGTGAAASSTTTGALRVTGGVGVSGAGYFGGVLNVTGAATFASDVKIGTSAAPTYGTAGKLYVYGGPARLNLNGADSTWNKAMTYTPTGDNFRHVHQYAWSNTANTVALKWVKEINGTETDMMSLTDGNLAVSGTGTSTFAGAVTIAGTVIHTLSATPASASAVGTVGTMSWDANYIYICTATNTWKRVAIATW